jgi:ribonucleotide reductase beta subunit family protein with ferritin-like domain
MNSPIPLPIETPSLFGDYRYPGIKELMEQMQDVAWFAQEISVENDKGDYRQKMSPEQFDSVSIDLQTFVEIEQTVGDVWNVIGSWFPHSEIDGATTFIAAMEKSSHAFFYQKMSDVLNIAPDTIAQNQETIQVLKNKLTFLKAITSNLDADKPLSLATVASIEQVLLFSNFGSLKSFRANGYNLISNTVHGVTYVINDEMFHGTLASLLHNQYILEYEKHVGTFPHEQHRQNVLKVLDEVIHHEDAVIDYKYRKVDSINDITAPQLKAFIRSRANQVLNDMNMPSAYVVDTNPIADWFYKGANSIKIHDFFVS